jgi:SAM-dependent methyltransferase
MEGDQSCPLDRRSRSIPPARLQPHQPAGPASFKRHREAALAVAGRRILHLQCHFGADSLKLVQRGATVVGLDFSAPAIEAARRLAGELGLADRASFVHADLYDAPAAIPERAAFDMVYVTWGAIHWLPACRWPRSSAIS